MSSRAAGLRRKRIDSLGLGYTVHLIDPVPSHVEQVSKRMAAMGTSRGNAQLGDARELDFGNASQDAALMLGPLHGRGFRPNPERRGNRHSAP